MTVLPLASEERRALRLGQSPPSSPREWAQVYFLIVKECCVKETVQDSYLGSLSLGVSIPGKVQE